MFVLPKDRVVVKVDPKPLDVNEGGINDPYHVPLGIYTTMSATFEL